MGPFMVSSYERTLKMAYINDLQDSDAGPVSITKVKHYLSPSMF